MHKRKWKYNLKLFLPRRPQVLHVQITVTNSCVCLHGSFALRTEKHLHDLYILPTVIVRLQTAPETPEQLEMNLLISEVLTGCHNQLQHSIVCLVSLPPDKHFLRAPKPLNTVELTVELRAPFDRDVLVLPGQHLQA